MAGQIVMEGFLNMKIKPWIRRLITRCVAILPALIVISIMGNDGTYKLLIFSQVKKNNFFILISLIKVILSLQLPFAVVPLIKFTSNKELMNQFVNPLWVIEINSKIFLKNFRLLF